MLASEELARLDLAAEELLESVAAGRTRISPRPEDRIHRPPSSRPNCACTSSRARRETWLYHAVTESDLLGKTVSLTDKSNLAGLLDPQQRDGLLSAAWLLVSDTGKRAISRTVEITVGPATESVETEQGRRIAIPIVLSTSGVPRNRVDPATWDAIRKVGQYSDSTEHSSLRVDIRCLVGEPGRPEGR